ncbi:MAG TPA: hypothetical protein VFV99_15360, partial [Kofleriaceae bacterium]|nr:hypothetical protein [Kofleriaceae bacterium]
PARGIVHLHSPYSHDACDGMPRDATGAPNEPCLEHLRAALCTEQIDFAALTDHDDTMADEEFTTLFSMRGTDTPVMSGSNQIASRIHCDDGHEVLITIGGENDLMPIMLDHHVAGTVQERHDIYNGTSATAIQAMRDAGALIWVAHTEQHPTDELRTVAPNGVELYNLHANIDPKIRADFLGLDGYGAITNAVEFADTNEGGPEPDLALLSFLTPNLPGITHWNELLAEGKHIPATAGSDAHENALPVILADGERGDSYRRVLRWFSNIVLVNDPKDITQIEAALAKGRLFSVFEIMGTPDGFDVVATGGGELGDTVTFNATHLLVKVPTVRGLDPTLPAPEIKATVIRCSAGAVTTVASGSGPELDVELPGPGAYRVEVSIVPRHLGPYLRDLGTAWADQELPWIYTSAIYVE